MQLDLRNSARFTVEHAIALIILTKKTECTDPGLKVSYLLDNHCNRVYAQNYDVNNEMNNKGGTILSLFLDLINSRVISLIKIKMQTVENATFE